MKRSKKNPRVVFKDYGVNYNQLKNAASSIQKWWRSGKRKGQFSAVEAIERAAKRQRTSSKQVLNQRAEQDGLGGSFSEFFYGKYQLNIPRSVLKDLAKSYYVINGAARLQSGVGLQNAFIANTFFQSADILNFNGIKSATNGRVLCSGVRAEIIMTNAANTTARVTIYDIIARKDLNSATVVDPAFAWKQGVDDEGGSGTNYQIPGATPFDSKTFTEFFKIRKVTHILLAQGCTHIHRVRYYPNKAVDYGTIEYGSWWKGLSACQLVVTHGQASNDVTTKSQVSIGASDINLITLREYESSYLAEAVTTWSASNNIPTSFTVGENTISVGAGLVETAANA